MPPALIYSLLLGTVALLLALVAVLQAERLTSPIRFMAAMVFAPLACFCVFGFGAAFEPGDYHVVWRWVYAVTFLACVSAMVRLGVAQRRDSNRPEGD